MIETFLYHYCSSDTFLSILDSKIIRLSSMRMSNDHLEGQWALNCLDDYLQKAAGMPEYTYSHQKIARSIYNSFDVFGFCFSEMGDSLSQWRGYADDGNGFSIGFSKEKLDDLLMKYYPNTSIRKVNYSIESFDKSSYGVFESYLNELNSIIRSKKDINTLIMAAKCAGSPDLFSDLLGINTDDVIRDLAVHLYLYKNPAFVEELEWRIVKPNVIEDKISFTSRKNRVVPYVEIKLPSWEKFVTEVYVGPKNISDIGSIRSYLLEKGIMCDVKQSSASYR